MSKTYMKKEKGDTAIICVALSDWARYRTDGYVFVETDEDGQTPEQQFVAQTSAGIETRAEENGDDGDDGDDEGVSMGNTKAEIVAYLVANDIDHDASSTKAELLELI